MLGVIMQELARVMIMREHIKFKENTWKLTFLDFLKTTYWHSLGRKGDCYRTCNTDKGQATMTW